MFHYKDLGAATNHWKYLNAEEVEILRRVADEQALLFDVRTESQ